MLCATARLIQMSFVTVFGFIFEEQEKNTIDIQKTKVQLKSNEWDQQFKVDKMSKQDQNCKNNTKSNLEKQPLVFK